MTDEATVYVVDDDASVRDALRAVIESVSLRVETRASCEEFLELYEPHTPGCLVLDVRLPGMSGFELQADLAVRQVDIPIIMITGFGDVSMAVRAIENGAIDYITKPFNDQVLLDRIRQALAQDAHNRKQRAELATLMGRYATLTQRQREVMWLVVAGKANKMIADELGVSCKTVEGHRAQVMDKMAAESLAALVRMGLALGQNGGSFHADPGEGRDLYPAVSGRRIDKHAAQSCRTT